MRGRGVEQARRFLAQRLAERGDLARGLVRQAEDREIDAGQKLALGLRVLAVFRRDRDDLEARSAGEALADLEFPSCRSRRR